MLRPIVFFYLRRVCALAGHDRSWSEGVALGFHRPICRRCRSVL